MKKKKKKTKQKQISTNILIENPKTQNKNESNLNLSNKKNSIKRGKNVSAPVPTTVSSLAIEEKSIGTGDGRKLD